MSDIFDNILDDKLSDAKDALNSALMQKVSDVLGTMRETLAKNITKEDLNEVSKKVLGNYIRAAHDDLESSVTGNSFRSGKAGDKYNKAEDTEKELKRRKGIDKAITKLTKEDLTEISRQALGNYIRAAHDDLESSVTGNSFRSGKAGDKYNKAEDTEKELKRRKGIDKAITKLTKEDLAEE